MASLASDQLCIICKNSGTVEPQRVGKGLDSLIRTSGEKKRTSLEKELVKRQEASRVVFVHRSCRKKTKKK